MFYIIYLFRVWEWFELGIGVLGNCLENGNSFEIAGYEGYRVLDIVRKCR